MDTPYTRKKQPEQLRRSLLDHAARLITASGLTGLTIQGVAEAAGVSKGGVLHHFPSKQALIEGVFLDFLASLEDQLQAFMDEDPEPYGRFTRAYVEAVLELGWEGRCSRPVALSIVMVGDAKLRQMYADWHAERLALHQDTDSDQQLELVRLTADGVWLADITEGIRLNRGWLREQLLQATRRTNK